MVVYSWEINGSASKWVALLPIQFPLVMSESTSHTSTVYNYEFLSRHQGHFKMKNIASVISCSQGLYLHRDFEAVSYC